MIRAIFFFLFFWLLLLELICLFNIPLGMMDTPFGPIEFKILDTSLFLLVVYLYVEARCGLLVLKVMLGRFVFFF